MSCYQSIKVACREGDLNRLASASDDLLAEHITELIHIAHTMYHIDTVKWLCLRGQTSQILTREDKLKLVVDASRCGDLEILKMLVSVFNDFSTESINEAWHHFQDSIIQYWTTRPAENKLVKELFISDCKNVTSKLYQFIDVMPQSTLDEGLICACRVSNYELVVLLVQAGADIQCYDNKLLYDAIGTNNLSLIKVLVENGADVRYIMTRIPVPSDNQIKEYLNSQLTKLNRMSETSCATTQVVKPVPTSLLTITLLTKSAIAPVLFDTSPSYTIYHDRDGEYTCDIPTSIEVEIAPGYYGQMCSHPYGPEGMDVYGIITGKQLVTVDFRYRVTNPSYRTPIALLKILKLENSNELSVIPIVHGYSF